MKRKTTEKALIVTILVILLAIGILQASGAIDLTNGNAAKGEVGDIDLTNGNEAKGEVGDIDLTNGNEAKGEVIDRGQIAPEKGIPICVTILDNFNRPDGPIGPDWSEQAGTFMISSNAAVGGPTALATYNGVSTNVVEADVQAVGTALQYTGVVLGYAGIDNNLFLKVQNQDGDTQFEHGACYVGNNGYEFGLGFYTLDYPFTTAHMRAELSGNSVTITYSKIDGGSGTQTYVCTGAPSTGGDGIGIAGYDSYSRIDNFAKPGCVIETVAYGAPLDKDTIDASILNPLRDMRDDNLKDEYVDRYYNYSDALTMVITRDSGLAQEAARLLIEYSPMVQYHVNGIGVDKQITGSDVKEIVSFTDRLARGVLKNRDEIGPERSEEILKFLDEFKEQINASEGKTFSEVLQDSIYCDDEQMPGGDRQDPTRGQ